MHVDGIAFDPHNEYFYCKLLVGRTLYRMPSAALLNESLSSGATGDRVQQVAETDVTDGLKFDTQGNLYLTSLERNEIKVLTVYVRNRADELREMFGE